MGSDFRSRVSPLIERWNGKSWHQVTVAAPADSRLEAVTADAPADAWAVGTSHDFTEPGGGARTLIEHWNGSSWRVVPSPDPNEPPAEAILTSVSARSPKDVWAAGYFGNGINDQTLIEHWNGKAWRIVPSPNAQGPFAPSSELNGISVAPGGRAWAVGTYGPSGIIWSLIERWDGRRWRIWPSPDTGQSGLTAVTATSPAGTWAVGWSHRGTSNRPEIARWTGRSWQLEPVPSVSGDFAQLSGVTSTTTRALAVGFQGLSPSRPLALAWNGRAWSLMSIRGLSGPVSAGFYLSSVSGMALGSSWIVGFSSIGTTEQVIAVQG